MGCSFSRSRWVSAWQLRRLAAGPMDAERLRLRTAQVWLGLLSLASFRSPFVPDAYALIGTLWLLTLIAAEGHWQAPGRIALVIGGAITMLVLDGGAIPIPVPAWIMAATLALQVAAFGLNLAVVLTPGRAPIASPGLRRPAAAIQSRLRASGPSALTKSDRGVASLDSELA